MDGLSPADVQALRNEMTMAAWDRYVLACLAESEEVREVRVEDAVRKAADFADVMMRVRGERVSKWLKS